MMPSKKHFGFPAMGSYCEIQIYDDSRVNAKKMVRQLSAEILRIEQKYARYRRDSFINEINRSAGHKLGIKIDQETRKLFDHALTYYEQSQGLFDITLGPVARLWKLGQQQAPAQDVVDEALEKVGLHQLHWQSGRLTMPQGVEVDLRSLMPQYAADSVAKLGRQLGIAHGLVNLGGIFAVIGPQPDAKPWTVGIANPQVARSLLATVDLLEGGLANSGNYDGRVILEGQNYSTIINPKTGWPGEGLRAVSIASKLCITAGAMGNIAMLMPEEKAIAWLKESSLPHVFLRQNGEIGGVGLKMVEGAASAKPDSVDSTANTVDQESL